MNNAVRHGEVAAGMGNARRRIEPLLHDSKLVRHAAVRDASAVLTVHFVMFSFLIVNQPDQASSARAFAQCSSGVARPCMGLSSPLSPR